MTLLSKRNKAPLVLLVLLAFSFTFLLPGQAWAAVMGAGPAAVTEQDDFAEDFRLTLEDDRFSAIPAENLTLGGDFENLSVSEVVYKDGTTVTAKVYGNLNNGTGTGALTVQEPALEGVEEVTATVNVDQAQADFAGGSGTEDDPYLIADAHQLNNVRKYLDAHFQLLGDIDLDVAPYNQDKGWEPIGTSASPFNGNFDGNRKVISGLYINRGDENYIGLFGYAGEEAILHNVRLEDVSVTGGDKVGGLVGVNEGIVMYCYATVAITGNDDVGGLVGENFLHVSGSYAAGDVNGDNYVGGLVGYNADEIADSYAAAGVNGYNYIGGLVGYSEWEVTDSYAAGNVDGKKYVGGLAGGSRDCVRYCYATGAVTGSEDVGGLVGLNKGSVYDSYYDRDTSGQSDIGKGEPRTTGEMQLRSTYAGWDFLYIWGIEDGAGYPVLRWQAGAPQSGFNAAASAWSAEVGVEFHLNITGAKGADGNFLAGSTEVIVYSDLQDEKVFQSGVEFIDGEFVAPVTLSLSTVGTHNLRVYVDGVSYSNLVTMEVVPPLEFAGGSGTPDDPYLIADAHQLNNVRHRLHAHFKLISDIDLGVPPYNQDRGWEPIGTSEDFPFQGRFNGNGYVIRNLTIDWPGVYYVGLFGYARDAVFRKINLENANVSGNIHVGGLVGYMEEGGIEDSTLSGSVNGKENVGGLAGLNDGGKISGSHAAANVEGDFITGGLAGENAGGILTGSFTNGRVRGSNYVGGLAGINFAGKITGSHTAAEVEGEFFVGGLAGASDGDIIGSFASGKVSGSSFVVGGLVGGNFGGKITGSHAAAEVEGETLVGGLAGGSDGDIVGSFANGKVSGNNYVGGLVGSIAGGTVSACYVGEEGSATGDSEVGGLAGSFANGEISNSYARAGVTGSNEVGGLVGSVRLECPDCQANIVNCYAAGAVLGDSSTGGLAGICLGDSSITGCYYDSEVTGCSGEGNQWGIPRTTAEMMRQATFAGWDFDTVWGIVEDHTYPYLQWQGQSGFTVAPAQAGNKTAGKAFELKITGATGVSGSYLDGDFNLFVTSDQEEGEVYNGSVTFTKGNAAVQVTLTALGKHTLTVTVAGVSGSETLAVTVKAASDAGRRSSTRVESPKAQLIFLNGGVSVSVPARLDSSTGAAVGKVEAAILNEAFDKSKPNEQGIKQVEIDIPGIEGAKAYEVILPAGALSEGAAGRAVRINTGVAALTLPGNMLQAADIAGAEKVSLTIAAAGRGKLTRELQSQIGDRPVIELGLKIDGKTTPWSDEATAVTVSIPYLPAEEELAAPEHITVWYIDGKGNVVEVPSGRYDSTTGTVTFSTGHFSNYAVVYVDKTFDDLGSVTWAKKQIEVLTSKGVLKGVSETEYAPQAAITRADFLYFLVRTLGVNAGVDENFDDIKGDAYYYRESGIAKKLGITNGTGNNRFSPDEPITRQDMMTLTGRALEMLKKLELQGTASDLDKFADKSLVADYAADSIASLVREGLIVGSGDKVNPLGNTTRAEAAVFLYRIYNLN